MDRNCGRAGAFPLTVLSGTYFIRSIVNPIAGINKTARQIAAGDFDARIEPSEKQRDDEISRLGETINYMASELGSTEKMKNEFISSVSHELRTPLTAIKGWGETVLSSIDDPTITKKGIDVIISESERLSVIVEDLLTFPVCRAETLNTTWFPATLWPRCRKRS